MRSRITGRLLILFTLTACEGGKDDTYVPHWDDNRDLEDPSWDPETGDSDDSGDSGDSGDSAETGAAAG